MSTQEDPDNNGRSAESNVCQWVSGASSMIFMRCQFELTSVKESPTWEHMALKIWL
ncbi:hypothetical protein [Ottowia thiooxydans]|uniref:hypothetical protein n=1 Tax=Ottowia thiooxydans TaxID=219182 RepID=UPI00040A5A8E|nr:hypothetical protein [Ottowia thiooxydans]